MQYQWTLLEGIHDGDAELDGISRLLAGKFGVLNLIPYNTVDGLDFRRPGWDRAAEMARQLHRRGVLTKLRHSAGQAMEGGCGRLRARMAWWWWRYRAVAAARRRRWLEADPGSGRSVRGALGWDPATFGRSPVTNFEKVYTKLVLRLAMIQWDCELLHRQVIETSVPIVVDGQSRRVDSISALC